MKTPVKIPWNTWIIALILSIYISAFSLAREQRDTTPSIEVLRIEDKSLVLKLTNNSKSEIMVDLRRSSLGAIGCLSLSVKAKSGASLTDNDVYHDGYWNPLARESDGESLDELQQLVVGISPASSVTFKVPIPAYLRNEPREVSEVASVSPRIYYSGPDGKEHPKRRRIFFR